MSRNRSEIPMKIEIHQSVSAPHLQVASIRGLDVQEACDAYTPSELRSIARTLENIAENLQYSNMAASTKTLWEQDQV